MKKLSLLFTLIWVSILIYAVPAKSGWKTVSQPDGSTMQVQLVGDEFHHYWIDREGNQIECDAEGQWQVASAEKVSARAKARQKAMAKMESRQLQTAKQSFAPRGLVILANFKDVFYQSSNTLAGMDDLMNGTQYNYEGATGSVRQYFSDQSDGQYVPEFDVIGPVNLPKSMSYYGGNGSDGNDLKPGDMIVEACSIANANFDVDFTRYDSDNDGFADFVYIIYAGKGEADGGAENTVWPHQWNIASAHYFNNSSYSLSQSVFDGITVNKYACSGEIDGSTGERTGIGTIAHEFGHVIGMIDLYDTDYGQNHQNATTPAGWHIMDAGSYCNEGKTPPNYTIFDKYYLGWKTPGIPSSSVEELELIAAGKSGHQGYQISQENTLLEATNTSTVYYIENRQLSGWDAYLPGHGLVIWKVAYNQSAWNDNSANNTAGVLRYTVVSASGSTSGIGSDADPFPGAGGVSVWTDKAGTILNNITETNGTISLTYINNADPEEPGDGTIVIKAKVPSTWTDDIMVWVWPTGGNGAEYATTKEGDWYVYTHHGEEVNIIFKNGSGWQEIEYQTIDMKFNKSVCLEIISNINNKADYLTVDCKDEGEDPDVFKVSVHSSNDSWGFVTGKGYYAANETVSLTASAFNGYYFSRWSDGNTENPRTITVTQDTTLTAIFAVETHDLELRSSIELSHSTITMGDYFYLSASIKNTGDNNFTGNIAIGLYDENKKFMLALEPENKTIYAGSSSNITLWNFSEKVVIPTGWYYVGVVYQEGNDWRLINSENYTSLQSLNVTYHDALELYWMTITQEKLYANGGIDVNISILNTASETFYGSYRVVLTDLSGHVIKTLGSKTENNGLGYYYYYVNGLNYSGILDVEPGKYLLQVSYQRSGSSSWYYIGTSYTNSPVMIEVLDPNVEEIPIVEDSYEYNNSSSYAYPLSYGMDGNSARLQIEASIHDAGLPYTYDVDYYTLATEDGYDYEIDLVLYDKYYQNVTGELTGDVLFDVMIDGNMQYYGCDETLPSTIALEGGKTISVCVKPYMLSALGTYELEINIRRTPIIYYNLDVYSSNTTMGSTSGSGRYREGAIVTLSATAKEGYHFVEWSDGNTDNPRTITVTEDLSLTAEFAINTYEVVVTWNTDYGTVTGASTYNHGETVTLSATANKGYEFVQWSDGSKDNPYTFVIENEVVLEAEFVPFTAVENVHSDEKTKTIKIIHNGKLLIIQEGNTYDALGNKL